MQKRKLAEEKKKKIEDELKKIPKLNQLFRVDKPSASTTSHSSTSEPTIPNNEIDIDYDTEAQSISEICDASENMIIDEVNVEAQLPNESTSSLTITQQQFEQSEVKLFMRKIEKYRFQQHHCHMRHLLNNNVTRKNLLNLKKIEKKTTFQQLLSYIFFSKNI